MFKDKDIICLSTISWDFLLQRHQIIMRKFAGEGNRIIYIENINPAFNFRLSIISKILKRLAVPMLKNKHKPGENIKVISPLLLPFKNKVSNFINRRFILKTLAKQVSAGLRGRPLIWTYLATSNTAYLIKELNPDFLVYDCVFDARLHPNSPKDIKESEENIIKSANLVLTDNQLLLERCKAINENTHLIHPGVDFLHFNGLAPLDEPDKLKKIAHPRLCFFGGIDAIRIDLELISSIAKEKPLWNIVLCGPVIDTDISRIKMKNIHLMGTLGYNELPIYLNFMDILILPYKLKPFTRSIFPAKIFECLASGKPVVSTPLEELTAFKETIALAGSAEDFIGRIEELLRGDSPQEINKRKALAMDNSWDKRFNDIRSLITSTQQLKRKP